MLQVRVPANYADELHEIVYSQPGARMQDDGGHFVRTFTITGPDAVIDALRPLVKDWEHDVASREAW